MGEMTPVTGRIVAPPGEGKLQIVLCRHPPAVAGAHPVPLHAGELSTTNGPKPCGAARPSTNVPPGKYKFRVQAFEMNMPESVSEASLEIEWLPHFYRTAWFLAACARAGARQRAGGLPPAPEAGAFPLPRGAGRTQPRGARDARHRDPGLRQRLGIAGSGIHRDGRIGIEARIARLRAHAGASHRGRGAPRSLELAAERRGAAGDRPAARPDGAAGQPRFARAGAL